MPGRGRAAWIAAVLFTTAFTARAQDAADLDAGPPAVVAAPSAGVIVRPLVANGATPIAEGRDVVVTAGELYDRVRDEPETVQRDFAADPALVDELVDRLVADRLLAAEARRRGLDHDPAVQAALERALVSRLRATVIDPDAGDGSHVTAAEIQAFYDAHPARFHIPERRSARVIFFTHRRDAVRVLGLARAMRHHRAVNDFRELAARYNTDADLAHDEGELRDLTPTSGEIDRVLREAIFAVRTPPDVVPNVVAARWHGEPGFFVVRVTARRAAVDRTLAESSDWIRGRLVLQHRVDVEHAMVERLARDANVNRIPANRVVQVIIVDAGVDVSTD